MKNLKVAVNTIGCRMNQFESSAIEEKFFEKGYQITDFEDIADIYIINTCTVTNDADRTSRKIIRKAKKQNPRAVVVATGCYAQVKPEELAKMEEIDIVVGNSHKTDILDIVENYINEKFQEKILVNNIFRENDFKTFQISTFFEGARPILKVQEGCNSFCSFCIIPFARGKVRSAKIEDIVNQAKILAERGYKEIVLTGTQLSQYGYDHKEGYLLDLLKKLSEIENLKRIRLSSMGINELNDELIDFITENPKIAKHFHLSIQSADDKVLKDMRRDYTVKDYIKVVEKILKKAPETAIGTDIITGFPTEDKTAFENSLKNIEKIPFAYIHVFTYSEREGTIATKLKSVVSPQEKKERTQILRDISYQKNLEFRRKFLQKEMEFLIISEKDGKKIGLTSNYIHAYIETEKDINQFVNAKLSILGKEREDNIAVEC
ncbi:tRNA (N(6)-L-threonylcarbamoyladenosine(37)-C(2))-methylthiotransferase MtaB [Venenivibrio stagnispumantis]|uniref:Threonylcarbamoyladenosine tRNA methylthiotransferase MtaB n=1 Tax=Venenivibrio stagnispumantis TaxID=407998 RepID=A0AA45WKN6_9AQUI|nr:tRNA (N(6)-L-threonylcarbamoyladenosine(37)-C(2))-methylthiotransferase MtaB [Venenivibrio stagnispumantis]MCW4573058.1 tRNA (N(6)-L-threonylcarbamoyladenosine(37)-C(2))-methylthiotransferase MtaB [Venenivibrio stagnispumantis]SMP07200.1 threonylcarbamoyladenosine tRNA methylthiotransferase MtaB [Venenivibrio stagnispumantis]